MKLYFSLFWAFFKIGLFTFGGGYAMLPMLQKEVVKKGWATDDELLDYYAIGQVTPGIIAVNVSTFVGFKLGGFCGACWSMLGIILPSFLIITALALGLSAVWRYPLIQHAFNGIKIVIPALILPIVLKMIKKGVFDFWTALIFIGAFLASITTVFSPIWIVLTAGLLGLLFERTRK